MTILLRMLKRSRSETEAVMLTSQQIRWLLEGLKIEQPKAIREGKPGALY